jgi:hypothetical protein
MPTVVELKQKAKLRGIQGYSTMRKAELENALKRASSAKRKSPAKRASSAKKCPEGKVRNTVSKGCRDKCTSAQRINPKTGRCVSKKASSPRKASSAKRYAPIGNDDLKKLQTQYANIFKKSGITVRSVHMMKNKDALSNAISLLKRMGFDSKRTVGEYNAVFYPLANKYGVQGYSRMTPSEYVYAIARKM